MIGNQSDVKQQNKQAAEKQTLKENEEPGLIQHKDLSPGQIKGSGGVEPSICPKGASKDLVNVKQQIPLQGLQLNWIRNDTKEPLWKDRKEPQLLLQQKEPNQVPHFINQLDINTDRQLLEQNALDPSVPLKSGVEFHYDTETQDSDETIQDGFKQLEKVAAGSQAQQKSTVAEHSTKVRGLQLSASNNQNQNHYANFNTNTNINNRVNHNLVNHNLVNHNLENHNLVNHNLVNNTLYHNSSQIGHQSQNQNQGQGVGSGFKDIGKYLISPPPSALNEMGMDHHGLHEMGRRGDVMDGNLKIWSPLDNLVFDHLSIDQKKIHNIAAAAAGAAVSAAVVHENTLKHDINHSAKTYSNNHNTQNGNIHGSNRNLVDSNHSYNYHETNDNNIHNLSGHSTNHRKDLDDSAGYPQAHRKDSHPQTPRFLSMESSTARSDLRSTKPYPEFPHQFIGTFLLEEGFNSAPLTHHLDFQQQQHELPQLIRQPYAKRLGRETKPIQDVASRVLSPMDPPTRAALKKSASMICLPFNPNSATSSNPKAFYYDQQESTSAPHTRQHSTEREQAVCRYFMQGYCSRGARCFYTHDNVLGNVGNGSARGMRGAGERARGLSVPLVLDKKETVGMTRTRKQSVDEDGLSETLMLGTRFFNVSIADFQGQYLAQCKDQFGCRFLQKQIQDSPEYVIGLIFNDLFPHLPELMVDPFGNYLCQKLIEYCSGAQRDLIINKVAPHIAAISLNMHGTRSVQKLIETASGPAQMKIIVDALKVHSTRLIKDLNGNHVIQKCLSKLPPMFNQFVYIAVIEKCIQTATHRHGCCVLQRCLDYAVETQKIQLVREIARNGLVLVQDPFGNYVVQYVLDLQDTKYSEMVILPFVGSVCFLSLQKFSSNVIEKCIRVAQKELCATLIQELLDPILLEGLLRDSYGNYVVQTALDCAEAQQKQKLIECIRPLLTSIRATPYAKRIQTKIGRSGV